ncbi:glycosyltransferase [Candidatus Shapirobacteria bacterium]|nr:glycosyltransferase [Candidatus Shapirobacteria bacterium]
MNKSPFFSIIIPIRVVTPYLRETIAALEHQTFKNFELIIVDDKMSGVVSPAIKRNLGTKKSQGSYLAFIDDDSYPDPNWLKNIHQQIKIHPAYAAYCGPCLTPPEDDVYQKASGLVWASFLGSGGAGVYRNTISKSQEVDDFPSVNLIVKKADFNLVHGFNTHHWPGEDTILCLDLTKKLHKVIYYHPSIIVYHHRRQVIIPHLQQITRYALHRGNFARIYPETSFRLGYLTPSFFAVYCLLIPLFINKLFYFTWPLYLYLALLFVTLVKFIAQRNNIYSSALAAITIPITHLYYGLLFIWGFFSVKLLFKPHRLSQDQYHGG